MFRVASVLVNPVHLGKNWKVPSKILESPGILVQMLEDNNDVLSLNDNHSIFFIKVESASERMYLLD